MLIKIGNFEFTEVWDGVFYKKLSQYPAISDWEKRNIIEFVEYEASHGRECTIECEDTDILSEVNNALQNREAYRNVPRPALCAARRFRLMAQTANEECDYLVHRQKRCSVSGTGFARKIYDNRLALFQNQ